MQAVGDGAALSYWLGAFFSHKGLPSARRLGCKTAGSMARYDRRLVASAASIHEGTRRFW